MSERTCGCLSNSRSTGRWAGAWSIILFLFLGMAAGSFPLPACAGTQGPSGTDALIRVEVKGPVETLGVPVYANLLDGAGNEYILTMAPPEYVARAGLAHQVIDTAVSPGAYFLALERRKGARAAAQGKFTIMFDDGLRILVKGGTGTADRLASLGFDIKALPTEPIVLKAPRLAVEPKLALAYDQRVADMISQVEEGALYEEVGNLSGENFVMVGGSPYTFETRHTESGIPIRKATQYVNERLTAMGLKVSYNDWSLGGLSGRNVVGEKTGKAKPTEIFLITCHLDDMPDSGRAPGADDNGSGCAALLTAARIMSSSTFDRTVRFVFFTGEEQGLFGSAIYATAAHSANEDIVAVYNMDMISWDAENGPTLRLHTRTSGNPGYSADLAIANTFSDVVSTYGLSENLTPIITSDGEEASDHSSFWDKGYAAILAIEDDYDDFTPYYHTPNDTLQSLNMAYFTNYAGASVGAAAHLAILSESSETALHVIRAGTGSGTVTSAPAGIRCGSACSASFTPGTSVTLTAAPSRGSAFAGWSGGCAGSSASCTVVVNGEIGVTATFEKEYKFTAAKKKVNAGDGTITSADGEINCGTTCSTLYHANTLVTLFAVPVDYSTFAGWSSPCSGTDPCNVTIDKAMTVRATFVGPQTLTVRKQKVSNGTGAITSDPPGISCGTDCSSASWKQFLFQQQVTLTAVADEGSVFSGWSPSSICSGTGTCAVTMDKAKTVTAKFVGPQMLTVRKVSASKGTGTVTGPGGIDCGETCKAGFTYDSEVTLTAVADEGSAFSGWSPSSICSGTGTCTVTMDKARTVTAKFTGE